MRLRLPRIAEAAGALFAPPGGGGGALFVPPLFESPMFRLKAIPPVQRLLPNAHGWHGASSRVEGAWGGGESRRRAAAAGLGIGGTLGFFSLAVLWRKKKSLVESCSAKGGGVRRARWSQSSGRGMMCTIIV